MHATTIRFLQALGRNAEVIAEAYANSRSRLDDCALSKNVLDELIRLRLVSHNGEESGPRLSSRLIQLLDYALHTERLRQVDISVGDTMDALQVQIQSYYRVREVAPSDAEHFLDTIHDLVDALSEGLREVARQAWRVIGSEFSVVTSLQAKKALNEAHLEQTRRLLEALKQIDLRELSSLAAGDRTLRRLFDVRLPRALEESRQNLAAASARLTTMLFRLQRLERRTALVKGFIRHFNKSPTYVPIDYTEQLTVPAIFHYGSPVPLSGSADIRTDSDDLYSQLVALLDKLRDEPVDTLVPALVEGVISTETLPAEQIQQEPLKAAVRRLFLEVLENDVVISGLDYLARQELSEDPVIWLYAILAEHDAMATDESACFRIDPVGAPDLVFNGNFKTYDLMIHPQ